MEEVKIAVSAVVGQPMEMLLEAVDQCEKNSNESLKYAKEICENEAMQMCHTNLIIIHMVAIISILFTPCVNICLICLQIAIMKKLASHLNKIATSDGNNSTETSHDPVRQIAAVDEN